MKRIFLLSSLLLLSHISSSQEPLVYEISGLTTAQAIISFSDSMRLSYPYHEIDRIYFDNTAHHVTYQIYPDRVSVRIPCISDEVTVKIIFGVIDSLARTNIYNNKIIVRSMSGWLASLGNEDADWQKEIAIKAALLDLEYSARFTSSAAIRNLPKSLYTSEIIDGIEKIFSSPFLSREEAEIIAQSRKPFIVPIDTTGYEELRQKYRTNTATEDEERQFRSIYYELESIQRSGKTIEEYTDSLNSIWHEIEINRWNGKLWNGCSNIISDAGHRRIYSLAPLIDSFATPEIRLKLYEGYSLSIDPIFARLKYKDYPKKQEEKYLHVMDSCIKYLQNNPDLDVDSVFQVMATLRNYCYDGMIYYIGTYDVFYKLAPLLLIANKMDSSISMSFGSFKLSVGAYFLFRHFMSDIENVPIPYDIKLWEWDENDIPAKMHQWMMDNKDNYQLRQNILYDQND